MIAERRYGTPAREPEISASLEHPALAAWRHLRPLSPDPGRIELLGGERRHSVVYRLSGAGPGGTNVVAKRSDRSTVETERLVYEKALPALGLPHPAWLGLRPDGASCWMFTGDAGDGVCPVDSEGAAGWLAAMHVRARRISRDLPLPSRTPESCFAVLEETCALITAHIDNPSLSEADRALLRKIVALMEIFNSRRTESSEICAAFPPTLVHGDYVSKNLRRAPGGSGSVLPLDWEHAGFGTRAPDLERINLRAYAAALDSLGEGTAFDALERLAVVGRLFRYVTFVKWAGQALKETWTAKMMRDFMPAYHDMLAGALRDAGWSDGI